MIKYITLLLLINFSWGQAPCEDQRYLEIKKKPFKEMSAREYEYFILIEKECLSSSDNLITKNETNLTDTICISTKFGNIKINLFSEIAPFHVESFLTHVKNGFYDGTIFHRTIPGFMIQGGDPNTKNYNKTSYGTGGHSAKYFGLGNESNRLTWTLPPEFNNIEHKRGIVSMARSNSPNSAGSQFFICVTDAHHLDGQYSVFGKVVDGLKIVDEIANLKRDKKDNPLDRIEISISTCKEN